MEIRHHAKHRPKGITLYLFPLYTLRVCFSWFYDTPTLQWLYSAEDTFESGKPYEDQRSYNTCWYKQ